MAGYWTPERKGEIAIDNLARELEKEQLYKKPVIVGSKTHTRWSSGVCLECGEFFHMITFAHAESHGYKSPNDMAKNGKINWSV